MTKHANKNLLNSVSKIRVKNNKLWMQVLALAIEARPEEARKLIRGITSNDQEVSRLMAEIAGC